MGGIHEILKVWSPHGSHLPFFEEMLHAHQGPRGSNWKQGDRVLACLVFPLVGHIAASFLVSLTTRVCV